MARPGDTLLSACEGSGSMAVAAITRGMYVCFFGVHLSKKFKHFVLFRNVHSFDNNERQIECINRRLTNVTHDLEGITCPIIYQRQLWLQYQVAQRSWADAKAIANHDATSMKSRGTWSTYTSAAIYYEIAERKRERDAARRKQEIQEKKDSVEKKRKEKEQEKEQPEHTVVEPATPLPKAAPPPDSQKPSPEGFASEFFLEGDELAAMQEVFEEVNEGDGSPSPESAVGASPAVQDTPQ